MLLLQKLDDGKVLLNLRKCGKCGNIIEVFQLPTNAISSESLLYSIMQDKNKDLKVEFESFTVSCPRCMNSEKETTFIQLNEEEMELVNNTPLAKIWVTVQEEGI